MLTITSSIISFTLVFFSKARHRHEIQVFTDELRQHISISKKKSIADKVQIQICPTNADSNYANGYNISFSDEQQFGDSVFIVNPNNIRGEILFKGSISSNNCLHIQPSGSTWNNGSFIYSDKTSTYKLLTVNRALRAYKHS